MDPTLILTTLLKTYWWLFSLLIFIGVLNSPFFKGYLGELLVRLLIRFTLDRRSYLRLHNVITRSSVLLAIALFLQPWYSLLAQGPRELALEEVTQFNRQTGWTHVVSPPQALLRTILADHLIENTEPLLSVANLPSFEYTFFFYNENQRLYRFVFYKSSINEKCQGYDAIGKFYHYKEMGDSFERTPNNGESGFARESRCIE